MPTLRTSSHPPPLRALADARWIADIPEGSRPATLPTGTAATRRSDEDYRAGRPEKEDRRTLAHNWRCERQVPNRRLVRPSIRTARLS
jgi:hypothetical protein